MRSGQGWRKSVASWLPWVWLIWVIVLLVLLWMVTDTSGTPTAASATAAQPAAGDSVSSGGHTALLEFGAFVVERNEVRYPDGSIAYASEGIRKLADALLVVTSSRTADGTRLRDRIEEVRVKAALIQADRSPDTRARLVRDAFVAAAEVMATIQASRYPHLDRAMFEAREAALRIRLGRPPHEQHEAIQRFFERSHDMLRAMTAG